MLQIGIRAAWYGMNLQDRVLLYAGALEPLVVVAISFTIMAAPRRISPLYVTLLWVHGFAVFFLPIIIYGSINFFGSSPIANGKLMGVTYFILCAIGVALFRLGLRIRYIVGKFDDQRLHDYLTKTLLLSYLSVGSVAYLALGE